MVREKSVVLWRPANARIDSIVLRESQEGKGEIGRAMRPVRLQHLHAQWHKVVAREVSLMIETGAGHDRGVDRLASSTE